MEQAGIHVTPIDQVTGFPEMMDGRVKTLHPRVHGGLLALRDHPDHVKAMEDHGIQPIDLVCVNLYPFEQTIARENVTDAEAIEAQVVENLQREDIHPLEESLGFKSLLQLGEPSYTIASIAARAGKSEAYVHGRIKLADLIPPVAEAFLKDTIAIGHNELRVSFEEKR